MQQFSVTPEVGLGDRMSDAEAQDVLRLHLQRTDGAPELSVEDVAEAIRLPAEDVRSLLAEVRRHKGAVEQAAPQQSRKRRDTRMAFVAAILAVAMVISFFAWTKGSWQFLGIDARAAEQSATDQGSGFLLTIGDSSTFVPSGMDPKLASASNNLIDVIDNKVTEKTRTSQAAWPHQTIGSRALEAIEKGKLGRQRNRASQFRDQAE